MNDGTQNGHGQPLFKTEYCNLPVSVPVEWRDFLQNAADELGTSRNSAFCMALKLGGPMLKAHVLNMRRAIRSNCAAIAAGKAAFSKILDSPAFRAGVVGLKHGRTKSATRLAGHRPGGQRQTHSKRAGSPQSPGRCAESQTVRTRQSGTGGQAGTDRRAGATASQKGRA